MPIPCGYRNIDQDELDRLRKENTELRKKLKNQEKLCIKLHDYLLMKGLKQEFGQWLMNYNKGDEGGR